MAGMDSWALVGCLVLVVGLVLLGLSARSAAARERSRAAARLAALERKVDAIAEHLGVALPEPQHPEVVDLLRRGEQVEAIRAYREATGADLLTAKNAVDEIARRR